ncbi:hypothetical protein K502DRAFT_328281 [Neoconidiobolus thromboides FSU 785]|nr:hypothetical protein K502DRAFT_328281 [Neoconidiobolus thromboides FSU 785]
MNNSQDNPFGSGIRIQPPPTGSSRGRRPRQTSNSVEIGVPELSPIDEKCITLFNSLNPENELLASVKLLQLFKETGLEQEVLGKIWNKLDIKNNVVSQWQFINGVKYLTLAQEKKELNKENLSLVSTLPQFKNKPPSSVPRLNSGSDSPWNIPQSKQEEYTNLFYDLEPIDLYLDGNKAKQALLDTKLDIDKLALICFKKFRLFMKSDNHIVIVIVIVIVINKNFIRSLADGNNRGSLILAEFLVAMHLAELLKKNIIKQLPQRVPLELAKSASDTLKDVKVVEPMNGGIDMSSEGREMGDNNNEVDAIKILFDKLPKLKNGNIASDVCVNEFIKSNLSQLELGKIWELASIRQMPELNYIEFEIAMLLIQSVLKGNEIPNELPMELKIKLQGMKEEETLLVEEPEEIEVPEFQLQDLTVQYKEKPIEYLSIQSYSLDEEYSLELKEKLNQKWLELKELNENEVLQLNELERNYELEKKNVNQMINTINEKLLNQTQLQLQVNKVIQQENQLNQQLQNMEELKEEMKVKKNQIIDNFTKFQKNSKLELGFLDYNLKSAIKAHQEYNNLLNQLKLPPIELPEFLK